MVNYSPGMNYRHQCTSTRWAGEKLRIKGDWFIFSTWVHHRNLKTIFFRSFFSGDWGQWFTLWYWGISGVLCEQGVWNIFPNFCLSTFWNVQFIHCNWNSFLLRVFGGLLERLERFFFRIGKHLLVHQWMMVRERMKRMYFKDLYLRLFTSRSFCRNLRDFTCCIFFHLLNTLTSIYPIFCWPIHQSLRISMYLDWWSFLKKKATYPQCPSPYLTYWFRGAGEESETTGALSLFLYPPMFSGLFSCRHPVGFETLLDVSFLFSRDTQLCLRINMKIQFYQPQSLYSKLT